MEGPWPSLGVFGPHTDQDYAARWPELKEFIYIYGPILIAEYCSEIQIYNYCSYSIIYIIAHAHYCKVVDHKKIIIVL